MEAPVRSTTWHILLSYGAIDTIMSYFTQIETTFFQALSYWMYARGIARVQTRVFTKPFTFFFAHTDSYTCAKTIFAMKWDGYAPTKRYESNMDFSFQKLV